MTSSRLHHNSRCSKSRGALALLRGVPKHALFERFWQDSRSDSFAPPKKVVAMRGTR